MSSSETKIELSSGRGQNIELIWVSLVLSLLSINPLLSNHEYISRTQASILHLTVSVSQAHVGSKPRKVVSRQHRSENQDYVAEQYLQVGLCTGYRE